MAEKPVLSTNHDAGNNLKLTIRLGILSVFNISLTFLFQWYLITQLGVGMETDAFFAGMTIPLIILLVISGSLTYVLVPILVGKDERDLRHDAWSFLILVSGLFGLLAIFLYAIAPWWVPLIFPGFSNAGKELTIGLTRVQLIGMVFTAVNGVQWAAYRARHQFIWVELTSIISSTVAFLLLVLALPHYGVFAAAWISVLRILLQTVLLIPGMGGPVCPNIRNKTVREAWLKIKPLLLGATYYKTDPLVDRFLLSSAESGTLSLYYLAQQIYSAISQVLSRAIATPLMSLLSDFDKGKHRTEFRHIYQRKLLQVGVICIFGYLAVCFFSQFFLNFFVGYGNITTENVMMLKWILIWLGGVLIGGAMGQICAATFYACGDTLTPTRLSMITYSIYIPCKIIAFSRGGLMELAIVTSIYFLTNLTIQVIILNRKLSTYS